MGTVKFGNDHVAKILGYGDYQIGNVTISRVYYMEGLRHNLFSVGKLCDSNLKVAFRQHTCFIRNLEGVNLLTGSRGNNLYTLSLRDMMASSPICLLLKALKTKSWLWHRRLSHLNFSAINHLAKHDLVRGLPKLKFEKDHLCSACAMGNTFVNKQKQEENPNKPKSNNILVIVDDYSRFKWVKCLRSKDEVLDFIIKFLKMIQVRLKAHVRRIKTDNGTEFVNQTLCEYYEKVGISHETSVPRSPQQNGVVERCNRTLIEVARIMLIYAKALLFLWAEAVATVCYTQNRSIIRLNHGKTPYEFLHDKLPDLSFFHVFGALCYPTNDSENLDFDELTTMASEHSSSEPALHEMTHTIISLGLMPNPPSSISFVPPLRTDWDPLFQPLFDELINPPPSVDLLAPEVIAPIAKVVAPEPAVSTGPPSSTTIDQDVPSPNTPLVSPFPHSDNDSDDEEVLNELSEYENAGTLRRERIINSFDGDDLAFECIGEFIMSDMAEVLMGRPFRKTTKLKYDVAKGLVSFTKIFDTYTYKMLRTIPRLKNFNLSKVPPLLELSQNDFMNGFRHPYEKYKFMYKNCLNLGPEYQVNESMKEWLIRGYVIFDEKKLGSS
ncbi:retrovirus-related pol polyprotein from transposon TNT 1-94 [Tanacetum coccineum]